MPTVFVQLSAAGEVLRAFACRQNWIDYPDQQEIGADDMRYIRFTNPETTLAGALSAKIAEINQAATAAAAKLTDEFPAFERETWPDQKYESTQWAVDSTAPTPVINAMAAARKMDRITYLQKTLRKVTLFQGASSYLVGTRQFYVDQAMIAQSLTALAAIRPVFSLPTVGL